METMANYLTNRILEPSMLLQNFVTVSCILLVLAPLRGKGRKRTLLQFVVLFLVLVGVNAAYEFLFNGPGSYYLSHAVLLAGYAAFYKQLRNHSVLATIINFYSVEIAIITLSSIFPRLLADATNGNTWEILFRNATVLLTFFVALFFCRFSLLQFRGLDKVSVGYSALTGSVVVILSLLYFVHRNSYDFYAYIFAACAFFSILVLCIVAQYLSYSTCRYREREKQLLIENYSMQNYRKMLQLNQQNLEDMRKLRHDIKNHFAYVGTLLHEGRTEKALDYFDTLTDNLVAPLSYIDCGNRCISAILNLEAAKAHACGAELDHRIMAAPELPISENDLCALLTNLIDNAIEAVVRQNLPDATVEVGINQKEDQLYLCVVNPVASGPDESDLLSLQTTKPDQDLHGYGHKIVDTIVEKYDGMLSRSIRNEHYIVDVVLNLPQTKDIRRNV